MLSAHSLTRRDKQTDRFPRIIFAVFFDLLFAVLNYWAQVFYRAVKTSRHASTKEVSGKASNAADK